jgi:Kef-type K+ transport system membrane component KefB
MTNTITLIITIVAILVLSPFLSRLLKIPTTPIEIILGAIAAYIGFIGHNQFFETIAEFAFLYLMFLAGMEVDIHKVMNMSRSLVRRGIIYLSLLYGLSALIVIYFNFSNIFLVIFPLISIGLVATLAKEYGSDNPWITLSITAGSIGEVVSIAILTVSSAAFEMGITVELYSEILLLLLFIGGILLTFKFIGLLFWWLPELKTLLMPHIDNQEQSIRLSIAILFSMLAVMLYLHLELAFGAFIAGIFIASFFKHKNDLPEQLGSFGFGMLIPLFFINVGSSFKLEALLIDGLVAKALLITFIMIGIRVIAAMAFRAKVGTTQAILLGLSHAMPLTLFIAVATLAYQAYSIDQFHYYAFILASIFQVVFVTIAIKLIHKHPSLR